MRALLASLSRHSRDNRMVVLLFDQFEEFFFLCRDFAERRAFYRFLASALDIPHVKAVFSLRQEYLHYLLECNRLPDAALLDDILRKDNLYYLDNLTPEDAGALIQSLTARTQPPPEAELIPALVADLARETGSVRPIELQVVGMQLQSEHIASLAQYRALGPNPKETLVNRYLGEVIGDCGAYANLARVLLYLLTNEDGSRPVLGQRELYRAVARLQNVAAQALDVVLRILVHARLVVRLPGPSARYQLGHDYLVTFIRKQAGANLISELEQNRSALEQVKGQLERSLRRARGLYRHLAWFSVLGVGLSLALGWTLKAKTEAEVLRFAESAEAFWQASAQLEAQGNLLQALRALDQWPAWWWPDQVRLPVLSGAQDLARELSEINRLPAHRGPRALAVAFSTDGSLIASCGGDGRIVLWNRAGEQLEVLEHSPDESEALRTAEIWSVAFSPDGRWLAAAVNEKWRSSYLLKVWPLAVTPSASGRLSQTPLIAPQAHDGTIYSLAFSPDSRQLVSAGDDGRVKLWRLPGDAQSLEAADTLRGHSGPVHRALFSPDGHYLVSAGADRQIVVWRADGTQADSLRVCNDPRSGRPVSAHTDFILNLAFSPDGKLLASVGADGRLALWQFPQGECLSAPRQAHADKIWGIAFSPDNAGLATASLDKDVAFWRLRRDNTGAVELGERVLLRGHQRGVMSVAFSLDGALASTGYDNTVRLWRLPGQNPAGLHSAAITAVAYSQRAPALLASADQAGGLRLWHNDGSLLAAVENTLGELRAVALSPDGRWLVAGGAAGKIGLWRIEGQQVQLHTTLDAHRSAVNSLVFWPDGQSLISGGADQEIKHWSLDGTLRQTLRGHEGWIASLSPSPDGRWLASASGDHTIRLWQRNDAGFNAAGPPLIGHREAVYRVAFSPDGTRLASAGGGGMIRLWDAQGKPLAELPKKHQGNVYGLAFSADGQWLASSGEDRAIALWSRDGVFLGKLWKQASPVRALAFAPTGRQLVSGGSDRAVKFWQLDASPDVLLRNACGLAGDYLRYSRAVEDEALRELCLPAALGNK